ncbi:alpha-galactosidase [Micromonospora craterilacus]|uniref:alpha-galactosidase n=1 Tax=Micromonospora craterilacus TaxID=1655439 RepID=A0A2W2F6V4_9ACTN|nr:alpha-galactosidase [Micromonospora craterilacus]PZG17277.1 alpha-galactosidase [Micromonospora craterilacus]
MGGDLDPGIAHLRAGGVSIVVDARGPGLPVVRHWGAELGDADARHVGPGFGEALTVNSPDPAVPLAMLPEASTGHMGRPGLRGHRAGAHWSSAFALADVTVGPGTARFTAVDGRAEVELVTEVELTPSGLARVRHQLTNIATTPYVLDGLEVALPVPPHAEELLDFTGRWARERHPQRRPFDRGAWVRENRRGRTGHDATIGLVAGVRGFGFGGGEVWAVHVAWSGNHVTYAQRTPDGRSTLGGGELLLSGEVILAAGQTYRSPWLYAGYSAGGLDGLSAGFHQWLRARAHHPGPTRPRPVVLNTWEAVYFDHDHDRLRALADAAAEVGVERFVLDDGWFLGRRHSGAGLGDWSVDPAVWPDGLAPLIDHVEALGMEFGLWVEPEMVNPDSDLFRSHPDWVLGPAPGAMPVTVRRQQVLNLAHPAAYRYILDRLDHLLRDHHIDYLKWDHNRDLVDAGQDGRASVREQTLAVYRLLAELRARHPGVEIESCSSGGARIDLQILEHTDRVWASDCNDALERQAIQRWTGLFLPPELIGSHVGPPRSHTTSRTHDLSFRLATAIFCHFGLEWDISTATEEERRQLRRAIGLYRDLRPLLHTGSVVRVDHPDPSAWAHGVVSADRSAAVFAYAQLATAVDAVPAPWRMPGLDPHRSYRVTLVDRIERPAMAGRAEPAWFASGTIEVSGRVLGVVGLPPPVLAPEQAMLVRLDVVGEP